MGKFIDEVIEKAKAAERTIVLPEGSDERTLAAAEQILAKGICSLVILGDPERIAASPYNLEGAKIIDNLTSQDRDRYAKALVEIRKSKGMTYDEACKLLDDVSYFGVMMCKMGDADGMVSGACHSTGDTLRPALQIVKTAPDAKIVSSFFVMCVPDCEYGKDGMFVFSDCGICRLPNAEELSEIAIASAKSFETLIGGTAKVALLSYSTKGSAKHELVDKVVEATRLAQDKAPELAIDGELQADTALVGKVASLKAPESDVAGLANVLIFPDLQAGNISYKLVQRLAKAQAYGPLTQGLAMPINDLSRGCSADDIVGVVAITCVQAASA